MTAENDVLEAVLSTREVSQALGLSTITIKRMRKLADRGGLPFVRLSPGRIGYLRNDVHAYIAARRVGNIKTA
jgi:predicted DNA-binding transcriptional regulator AlpA